MTSNPQSELMVAVVKRQLGAESETVQLRDVSVGGNGSLQIVVEPNSLDESTLNDTLGECVGAYSGGLDGRYALFDRAVIDIVLEEEPEITNRLVVLTEWVAARGADILDSEELLEKVRDTYHIVDEDGEAYGRKAIIEWLEDSSG